MSVPALSSVAPTSDPAWARELNAPLGMPSARGVPEKPGAADIKKAAGQFEAIMLRQLLAPSIEPMMSGGLGGDKGSGSGGGVYGYLLTDVLCNSLGASGGLGLGRMLEKQLTPAAHPPAGKSPSPSTQI